MRRTHTPRVPILQERVSVSQQAVRRRRAGYLIVWAMLGCALVLRWNLVGVQPFDDDEFQHAHFAWCLTQGMVPYQDFWDNHPPGLHELLAGMLYVLPNTPDAMIVLRRVMFFLSMPLLVIVFVLGRASFGRSTAWLGLVYLMCTEVFIAKAVEVRPDVLLMEAACLSFYLMVRSVGVRSGGPAVWRAVAAGAVLGIGFVFSTKAIVPLAAQLVALGVLVRAGGAPCERPTADGVGAARCSSGLGAYVYRAFVMVAAFAVVAAWWLGWEAWRSDAWAAFRYTLLDNVGSPNRFRPWPVLEHYAMYGILPAGLIGAGLVIVDTWRTVLGRGVGSRAFGRGPLNRKPRATAVPVSRDGANDVCCSDAVGEVSASSSVAATKAPFQAGAAGLVVWTLALMGAYLFVMPAPYAQSTFLFLPGAAMLAGALTLRWLGLALAGDGRPARSATAWAGVLVMVGLCVFLPLLRLRASLHAQTGALTRQVARMTLVHDMTTERDVIFDGKALAVFRRHALFYPSLVDSVLLASRDGTLRSPIRDQLRDAGCTLLLRDSRIDSLPEPDRRFIEAHFVCPTGDGWIYLPGQSFDSRHLASGVVLDVITPGTYRVERHPRDTVVTVDGQPVGLTLRLARGPHRVAATRPMFRAKTPTARADAAMADPDRAPAGTDSRKDRAIVDPGVASTDTLRVTIARILRQ